MGHSEIKTDALWDSFSYIDYYEKVLLQLCEKPKNFQPTLKK